ncbi:LOW QUALITY PROTEIN: cysteine protease atg4da [Megalobrama amblycephala]|uniref:LOW QUALITY PROTEIN: cysteine protease atg4da n=1 Tax=Megalobrama amblycephala TaxID=75352 RepID=UPI002014797A|nr:LOW QUALITY PROTEIN: cysteine protease atg4da [Megalobrama amblycephala]
MDVSDEFDREMEPVDDLASFEVVNLSNPGLLDLSADVAGHGRQSKEKTKLKTKLVSAWNNVRYGGWSLKSRPRLSKSSPVCLLGQSYQLSYTGERESFRRAFSSLLWMTYRRGFPPLDGSALSSDAGWGCMLRSAQMLLAQGLLLHMMPAGWTWPATHHQTKDDLEVVDAHLLDDSLRDSGTRRRSLGTTLDCETQEERTHRRLVSWFGDSPSALFGLHRLVELGRASGKRAGDWYGPAIAAHILQKAVSASELSNLAVYVAQDCTVYIGDVLNLCGTSHTDLSARSGWKSLVLLVPVRLGSDTLNPAYTRCVKRLLELRCCMGIIGGKPKHSLFFVGFQDDQLIYLDPHYCQTAVDVKQVNFPLESFHCKSVRKMPFNRMDPSCTVGFYAESRADFQTLCSDVTKALTSSEEKYPIFTFVEGHNEEDSGCSSDSVAHIKTNKGRSGRIKKKSSMDDFVLL